MNYITPAKTRKIDKRIQEEFDIPAIILGKNDKLLPLQLVFE